jgi:hypothetical protein
MMRRALSALFVAVALLGGGRRAEAQRPTNRPTFPSRPTTRTAPGVRDTIHGPRDTLRTAADSAKADTTGVPTSSPLTASCSG